jgi:50S ribosomal subunit-associated GTPase HflX
VMNKCDRMNPEALGAAGHDGAIQISAKAKTGLDEVRKAVSDALSGCYPNR